MVDVEQLEEGKALIYTATVAVKPEVTLGQYIGLEVERINSDVTEEDIMDELKAEQNKNSRMITVEDRAVADGDIVTIDFDGYVDGQRFEGGLAEDYPLTIGTHTFIDTFEEQLIGKNIGDEVEVAILKVETKGEKLSLSRKALMDNPWGRVTAQYGDLVDFKVVEITEKGLKVEALGVDGYVPTGDAVIDLKNASLDSYYAVGDEGKAYITDIRPREWFLKLSVRKYLVEQERKSYEKYLEPAEEVTVTLGEKFKDLLK